MKHLSVYDHTTGKRLAFLQNAFNIGYTLEENALWTARFSLPYSDPKRKYCAYFNFVEFWESDPTTRAERYIGLFRIMPATANKMGADDSVTYECEHVLATLMDDVLLGWHQIGNIGVYTNQVLAYILSQQTVKRWTLGDCAFWHQYLYGWEHENLLAALFSVPAPFTGSYRWEFDTRRTPWTLHLRIPPTTTKAELRYRKNLRGVEKVIDPSNICTRLYAFGYGEGENALNISKKPCS